MSRLAAILGSSSTISIFFTCPPVGGRLRGPSRYGADALRLSWGRWCQGVGDRLQQFLRIIRLFKKGHGPSLLSEFPEVALLARGDEYDGGPVAPEIL